MKDAALLDWLLDDGPDPGPELRRDLAERSPPPGLSAHTLSLVDSEWASRIRWTAPTSAALALAASALIWMQLPSIPPLETDDPTAGMVAKGLEQTPPSISLKMAVRQGEALDRHQEGFEYAIGDVLYFRASIDSSGWVHLVRIGEELELIASQQLTPGEFDLGTTDAVHSWSLDAADSGTQFALIGNIERLSESQLAAALERASTGLCDGARAQGWSCDARMVEVNP